MPEKAKRYLYITNNVFIVLSNFELFVPGKAFRRVQTSSGL